MCGEHKTTVKKVCFLIDSELSVALVEEHLSEQVAKNVGKCIKMFAVKTEQQISNGPEAAQVLGKQF